MIDLHAHTRASDGQYAPSELVVNAHHAGLRVLAVTDHDTIAGLAEALEAGAAAGLEVVPGIELSAFVHGREAHILGHFVDPEEQQLCRFAEFLREHRVARTRRMVARLAELGVETPFDEVVAMSGGKNLGRPHVARVMIARGYVGSIKEAFDRYIGVGKPAYVERYELGSDEAISLIDRAGGCATLAHAFASGLDRIDVATLKEQGLAGLEVEHPDHDAEARRRAAALAREFDLVPTCGSDYHGELIAPERRLGSTTMPPAEFLRLRKRARRG
jgi:predicted metal-dependent phosphoesterase TrpH